MNEDYTMLFKPKRIKINITEYNNLKELLELSSEYIKERENPVPDPVYRDHLYRMIKVTVKNNASLS